MDPNTLTEEANLSENLKHKFENQTYNKAVMLKYLQTGLMNCHKKLTTTLVGMRLKLSSIVSYTCDNTA